MGGAGTLARAGEAGRLCDGVGIVRSRCLVGGGETKEEDRVQQDRLRLRDIVAMLAERTPFASLPPMLSFPPTIPFCILRLAGLYFLFSTE